MSDTMIKIEHVSKEYRLGAIGGTTLRDDLQRLGAKVLRKEDPTLKIGQKRGKHNERFLALDDVNFEVKKGEAIGIIGHNGAGKSTLLKLLCRVTAPSKGKISFNGRIASMLEVGTGFHPELTGRENVYMNGAILGMTKAEIDRKIDEIIEFSEIGKFIDTPVKRYSSGMYVKLAFSVAAHLDSEIMIMDEVLAVGDVAFQNKCLKKMREAATQDGKTVLYVSHNMNTIRQLCQRCVVLDHGKVAYIGDTESAIEVYLKKSVAIKSYYEFTKAERKNQRDDNFILRSISVDYGKKKYIQTGDTLNIHMQFLSVMEYKGVRFRFEIYYQDESIAGSMLSDELIDCSAGEIYNIGLRIHTNGLAPGRYYAVVLAYYMDSMGNSLVLDRVEPGFIFEVNPIISEGTPEIMWLHNWWGHVRLGDIERFD